MNQEVTALSPREIIKEIIKHRDPEPPSMEDIERRGKYVKAIVAQTLINHPSTKGNYRELLWRAWEYTAREHDINLTLPLFELLLILPSPETVGRRYREIKEEEIARLVANPEYEPISIPSEKMNQIRAMLQDYHHAIYGNGQTHLQGDD
jgi:hypothetical protein